MTCIVGLKHEGIVWIGGDSAGVAGLSITTRKDPKVFVRDKVIFGFTSSFRMGQLLMQKMRVPKRHADTDTYEYMITDFIDAVRTCFTEGGFKKVENAVEQGGCFLVGHAGRLFKVEGDFQVGEALGDYDAAGCGEDIALGAMHATAALELSPKARIKRALAAAVEHSAGVRPPFVIQSI